MRLLFVLYGSLDQISGGYLYDRRVIAHLRAAGMEVDLHSIAPLPYLLCPLHRFDPVLRRVFGPRRAAGEEGKGYDLIVVDELTHPSVSALARREQPGRAPVCVLLHHLKCREPVGPGIPSLWRRLVRPVTRAMERRLLSGSEAIITNSRTTAGTVASLLRRVPPVYVCPPGSDTFPGLGGPAAGDGAGPDGSDRPVRLLVTGNIIPRKGHDLLLRALGAVRELDWELWAVGAPVDRRYLKALRRLAMRLGLEERIQFTRALSGQQLRRRYQEADVFVFPSRYEGYGISLAEALHAGLPFVAFSSGAIPELSGGKGALVRPGDGRGFAQSLRRLIADAAVRREAASLSRELARRLPTWEDTGRCFLNAVRRVADGRR